LRSRREAGVRGSNPRGLIYGCKPYSDLRDLHKSDNSNPERFREGELFL